MSERERKRDRLKRLFRGHDSESSGPEQTISLPLSDPSSTTPSVTPSSTRDLPSQVQQPSSVTSTTGSPITSQSANAHDPTPEPAQQKKVFSSPHQFVEDVRIKDFWSRALQTLSDENKVSILPYTTPSITNSHSTAGMLEELCSITKRRQEECEKKDWKCTILGRDVILRDVAAKIINWLDKFKEVGDVAANFDPVHLSLPWAGIRFLLQAAVAESQQMAALLTGIEKVTYVINRCKVYEILYLADLQLSQSDQAIENLESALVATYAAILQFLGSAISLYKKSTPNRASHALWHPGELTSFITTCQTLEERVAIEATNCERLRNRTLQTQQDERVNKLKELLSRLQEPIVRTDSRVAGLWDRSNQEERLKILQWASSIPYEKNHLTARYNRTADTGEWILKHPQYQEWRQSSASMILWLHGIPGAGKTKLISRIIDDLHHAFEGSPNDEALAYFYCDRNQTDRQDLVSVLQSFARQLSMARNGDAVQPLLVQLYNQNRQKGFASGELSMEDSQALLHQYVDIYPQTTFVLDALDECDRGTRQQLIDTFDSLLARSSKPIKIFISSRPDDDIKDRFRGGPNVEIRATDNHQDIAKFVIDRVKGSPRWRKKISAPVQEEVVAALLEKSQGMFQWAALQIHQLLELYRENDVRNRLGKLPKDLEKAYDEIYAQIQAKPGSEPTIADRAFQWVMCSIELLRPEVLVAAVCQDPDKDTVMPVDINIDDVLRACHNLVVVDPQLKLCRFSHLSVQEHFEKIWTTSKANGFAAKTCLVLLNDPRVYEGELEGSEEFQREPEEFEWDSEEAEAGSEEFESTNEPDQCLEPGPGTVQDQYGGEFSISDQHDESGFARLIQYARLHWIEHIQRHGEEDIDRRLPALLMSFLGCIDQSGPAYRSWYEREDKWICGRISKIELDPPSSASFAICAFGFMGYSQAGGSQDSQMSIKGTPEAFPYYSLQL